MSLVRCEFVSAGLRDSEALACIKDVKGRKHVIRVEKDFLTPKDGYSYITIGIVGYDRPNRIVLVEFPHEPETGVNRIWVREDLLDKPIGIYS